MKKHRLPGAHISAALVALLVLGVACSPGALLSLPAAPRNVPVAQQPRLPGQQVWRQGVSSYLFGTNDTQEWSARNLENQPAIQASLHDAGFTLMRSFFLDNASDAAIEQRIRTIERSGAACLGVITNIANVSYDEHLVRELGRRCLLYEFGNEPDYSGISVDAYVAQWDMVVPLLRRINPHARFIGPVVGPDTFPYLRGFLMGVKASGILPDALSFHLYPCWQIAEADCLSRAGDFGQAALQVRALVENILGSNLPVGISEWNYDPGNPPAAYGDDPAFITRFSSVALTSMAQAGVAFACQFDAASYAGYGRLDLFQVGSNRAKPQYYAIRALIAKYRPPSAPVARPAENH